MRRLLAGLALVLASPLSAQTADKWFDSNGVQIRYVVQGVGDPVLGEDESAQGAAAVFEAGRDRGCYPRGRSGSDPSTGVRGGGSRVHR